MSLISKYIDKRLALYQSDFEATHYNEVNNMYKQMRGWRHDYKNHIAVMKSYAKSNDLDSLINYLDQLNDDLTTIDSAIKTGNRMVDAILNSKISLARSKNIPVVAEAQIFSALTTPELDLCIIIGNLFDNAIEASLPLPEEKRIIRVFMEMKGSSLYTSFTNMTATKKQRKFISTKGKGHGFGLIRIDNIVERHDGYIRRSSEDGVFTTDILLPQ